MTGSRSLSRAAIFAYLGVIVSCFFLACLPALAQGEKVSMQELIEDMEKYDGHEITIEGEVVGDLMIRGDYAWVTVNDDPYSQQSLEEGGDFAGFSNIGIGVWMDKEKAALIKVTGGYNHHGDRIRVTGTFHRACHEHGGDCDIHARLVEVVLAGHPIDHPLSPLKVVACIILAVIAAILWVTRKHRFQRTLLSKE